MQQRIGSAWAGVRHAFRVIGFAAMLVLCTAMSCYVLNNEIQYAPAYGYVVKVQCSGAKCSGDYAYVAFNTYQQAKDWLGQWTSDRRFELPGPPYGQVFPQQDYPELNGKTGYRNIEETARPLPDVPPTASPELNQQQPFVPQ